MSASGRSSDNSKKLITLLLSLLVIVILFTAIIVLWATSGDSSASPRDTSNTSVNTSGSSHYNGTSDNGFANITTIDGITRTSLAKSIGLLYSTDASASWLNANPDWRLFMAQADYMDSKGLSKLWSLVLRSANGSLVAYVDNGAAFVQSVDDYGIADTLPASGQVLRDSNDLLSNVTGTMGISAGADLTPFSFVYNDDGGDGIYRLSYNNPADVSTSFVMAFNAKSGEAIEG